MVASSNMHFVALIKGMPLKIRSTTATYEGDQWAGGPVATHNEASVDSELSALPFLTRQISGAIPNPYFQSFRGIVDYDGPRLLLVCRLDGPTFAIVRRMIVDAIAAEKSGLWGRGYVDGSNNAEKGFEMGDKWMAEIVQQMHKTGIPVVYDDLPAVFPDGYPMTDCSLYYGWYAGGMTGPFARPDFRFLPGAVAVHIHSFSANTLRDPNANWVAPLLAHGAAATMGNVYEPYFSSRRTSTFSTIVCCTGSPLPRALTCRCTRISWMSTIVGDPLYRPYASWLQIDPPKESLKTGGEWKRLPRFRGEKRCQNHRLNIANSRAKLHPKPATAP